MAETIKHMLAWIGMIFFCAFFWVAMIRGCVGAEPIELKFYLTNYN